MNTLAIDQGTSATKALVVSEDGSVLASASSPVNPRPGAGGAVEQDPQELLDSIVAAGRQALDGAGVEVGAVGIGNQGETVLRWDPESGRRSARRSAGRTAAPPRSPRSWPGTRTAWSSSPACLSTPTSRRRR